VKNGSLGTVAELASGAIAVRLDGREGQEVEFRLDDYSALDHGYAATIHKAQGATVERAFVLATPGMDRHLAYVAMTRHRERAEIFASREDFQNFEALKERLSCERMKDTTLDYAERRGFEVSASNVRRDNVNVPERDPIEQFKKAQLEFIQVTSRADIDPVAKARVTELRQEMKQSAQDIAKDSALLRQAERLGIASQIRSIARQNQNEASHAREKNQVLDRDEALER
jgi:hypothetical protein